MKQIRHTLTLTNNRDLVGVEEYGKDPRTVRSAQIEGILGTGCIVSFIPEEIVEKLGLRLNDAKARVRDANGHSEERATAQNLLVELIGRKCVINCVVGPRNSLMLIGQNIITELDVVINGRTGELSFSEPDMPVVTGF